MACVRVRVDVDGWMWVDVGRYLCVCRERVSALECVCLRECVCVSACVNRALCVCVCVYVCLLII